VGCLLRSVLRLYDPYVSVRRSYLRVKDMCCNLNWVTSRVGVTIARVECEICRRVKILDDLCFHKLIKDLSLISLWYHGINRV